MKSIVLLSLLFATIVCGAFDATYYPNKLSLLEDRYTLYWKVEGDYMRIGVQAKTTGWVGFGIAEPTSGSMHGSDILIATVKNGKTELKDMFALTRDFPAMDDCQNWELVAGDETNGITTFEARRKLNTTDSQDRPFTASARIVVAIGTTDTISKHADDSRKPYAVRFWGDPKPELPKNAQTSDYTVVNYTIPAQTTTYYERSFDAGFLADVSVIAIEPLIDNTRYVHHFLAYGTTTPFQNLTGLPKPDWKIFWAWAPGMDPLVVPKDLGFTFGPSNFRSIRLQIHYDNPTNDVGEVDSSGMRFYFQTTLRPLEAGVMMLGDPSVTNPNPIKAGSGVVEYEYDCPSACFTKWNKTLHVWGNFLHMHQIGTQMWGKQWRNGQLVRETNRIDFWDFGLQQLTPKEHTIEPGDRVSTHCVFQQQKTDVPFGQPSDEEMCIQFVYYYPKMNPGDGFCGFLHNAALGVDNTTLCDKAPMVINGSHVSNPSVRDPPGGNFIEFGVPNPKSFVCPVDSTETKETKETKDTKDTTPREVEDNASRVLAVTFVLTVIALVF